MKELKQLIDSKQWIEAKHYILNNQGRIEEIADTLLGEIRNHTRYTASDVTITIRDQNGIDHEISGFSSDDSLSCGYILDVSSAELDLSEKPTWCGDDLQFKQEYEGEFISGDGLPGTKQSIINALMELETVVHAEIIEESDGHFRPMIHITDMSQIEKIGMAIGENRPGHCPSYGSYTVQYLSSYGVYKLESFDFVLTNSL